MIRRKEEEKKKKKNLSSVIKARAICAYSSDVPNEALSKMLWDVNKQSSTRRSRSTTFAWTVLSALFIKYKIYELNERLYIHKKSKFEINK